MLGKLILFGSGETSPTGKTIHRKILQSFSLKQNVVILETPAGFQPNSHYVAEEVADVFRLSLSEFVSEVVIISARKKGAAYSPDDLSILHPIKNADYIFLGPGSPTYTVRQLRNSKALQNIINRWESGATLSLSSAAAIAFGEYTLPVYEIYKAGEDLHWKKGLNIFSKVGLSFSVITHWNNKEGGAHLDTRYCFMGSERFDDLLKMLPLQTSILGIDEHTAVVFDFQRDLFSIEGKGNITLLTDGVEIIFEGKNLILFLR